jgi:hypothetical protein
MKEYFSLINKSDIYFRFVPLILFFIYTTISSIYYPDFVNQITAYIVIAGCFLNFVALIVNNYKMPVYNIFNQKTVSYNHVLFNLPEEVRAFKLCDIYHFIKYNSKKQGYTITSLSVGDLLIYIAIILSIGNLLNSLQSMFI